MKEREENVFRIESSGFCGSGIGPRWTWWLCGVAGTGRYGLLGTDEQGHGLYLFRYSGDACPQREALLCAEDFSVPEHSSQLEATAMLTEALERMGWGRHHQPRARSERERHDRHLRSYGQ